MSLTRPQYPDTPGTRRCVWFSTSCCAAQPHGSAQRPLATPLSLGAERMSEKRFALKKTNAMHVRAGHDTMSSLRMPAPPSLSSIWDPHLVSLTPALPTFSLRNHSSKVKIQVASVVNTLRASLQSRVCPGHPAHCTPHPVPSYHAHHTHPSSQPSADHPHQQVWAALTSARTPESVPLSYQMVADPTTVFPQRKAKVRRTIPLITPASMPPPTPPHLSLSKWGWGALAHPYPLLLPVLSCACWWA